MKPITTATRWLTEQLKTHFDRVYPLCAVAGTDVPFIIYRRVGAMDRVATKDGWSGTEISYEVEVVTDTYKDGLELLDDVIYNLVHNSTDQHQVVISNTSELFDDQQNLYIQQIQLVLQEQK
jgi:hypothetical protein